MKRPKPTLFSVSLYMWDKHGYGANVVRRTIVGTRRAAMLAAESMLAPHAVTTTPWTAARDIGNAPWCTIHTGFREPGERKRHFLMLDHVRHHVDAPVAIVPSVGELGGTP